ncbi:lyase family protein, partial [Actinacidiphila rubida]
PVAAATSDGAWLAAMLQAEAALARAQAQLGTIPQAAAQAITAAAAPPRLDLPALGRACRESANPVVALVRHFTAQVAALDPQAAAYVHRGSTSQDILDTATVLVAGHALAAIRQDLADVEQALAALARTHRASVMAGRTLALHAVPTTFGLKAAGWRHLVLDAVERLDAAAASALLVQLGGAAGTMAGYLQHAPGTDAATYAVQLPAAFARQLGLRAPLLPWHVLRTPIADLAAAAAFTCGALGKIAADVLSMARTEVGEVAEPAPAGRGASSAMPHKRNPVLATAIRSAALQAPQLAATVWGCLPSEDERSAGAWHAEWEPLRGLLRLAGGAARQAVELTGQLHVDATRMAANAELTAGQIVSEKVAAHLAARIGKDTARALLDAASRASAGGGRHLQQALDKALDTLPAGDQDAARTALATAPGDLFAPAAYLGAAPALTDAALSRPLPPLPGELTRIRGAATRSA